jgi:hypothetical protein
MRTRPVLLVELQGVAFFPLEVRFPSANEGALVLAEGRGHVGEREAVARRETACGGNNIFMCLSIPRNTARACMWAGERSPINFLAFRENVG